MKTITPERAIEIAKNNYVKIILKDVSNQKKFDKFLQSMLLSSRDGYKIDCIDQNEILDTIDIKKLEENITEESSVLEVSNSFIDGLTFGDGIDQNKIRECLKELYFEAIQNS
jgi:hypothetical protein